MIYIILITNAFFLGCILYAHLKLKKNINTRIKTMVGFDMELLGKIEENQSYIEMIRPILQPGVTHYFEQRRVSEEIEPNLSIVRS